MTTTLMRWFRPLTAALRKLQLDAVAALLLPLLPLLLSALWLTLRPLMSPEATLSAALWPQLMLLIVQWLPLLAAQLGIAWYWQQATARGRRSSWGLVWLVWCGAMLLYPAALLHWSTVAVFRQADWLLAVGLSLLYWCHLLYQRQLLQHLKLRWLWSLDTLCGLAAQPIPVRLDFARIAAHPGLFVWYFCQFLLLAAVIFACYYFNRYYLMRRILARHGLLPFVLVSLSLMLLSYAPLAALLLQLPLNQVAIPALPAGNHQPFDSYNLQFMFFQWLLSTPLILAFERQQQEQRLVHIQHQQLQTELQLLQQQINPHFLFNTLNNLYALCLTQSTQAPSLVLQLADLLRYVVYQGQQSRVTLAQELTYLQHYLALQQLRVSHKTTINVDFPAQADQWQLPPLLLIMLLENAYKHGVDSTAAASWIELRVRVEQQRLYFSCRNSWQAPSAASVPGVGLQNLRRRLQLYYGDQFVLHSAVVGEAWQAELQLELELC